MRGPSFEMSEDNGATWKRCNPLAWSRPNVLRHMVADIDTYVVVMMALFSTGECRVSSTHIMRKT